MATAMTARDVADEMAAQEKIFLSTETIKRWAKKGWLEYRINYKGWYMFSDGEATIKRIKGLYNGTIQQEDNDDKL